MLPGDRAAARPKEGDTMAIRYSLANMLASASNGLNVLTDDEITQIHLATLDVLWSVGIKVESARARELLGDHGCLVDETARVVKFPANLVEDAIQSTPAAYRAHALNPENDYVPGGKKTGFVNFGEAPALTDPTTRKIRAATKKDVDDTVRFVDCLTNVVGWERPLTPQDLPADAASIYNTYSFFTNSAKHGFLGIYTPEHLEAAIKMGAAFAGSEQALKNCPTFTCSADPEGVVDHYEYRYQIDGGTWIDFSNPLTIINPGEYIVQCRACTSQDSSQCTDYDTLNP